MPRGRRSSASPRRSAPPAGDTALDEVLRFMGLIWAVDHELERVSKGMEARLGLTIPQRFTLLLVGRHPGMLASELADVLHLHRSTLSGVVRRLEKSGYLVRKDDAADARRARLTVTAAGREASRRREGTFEEAVSRLLHAMPASQRAAAERVLARLAEELQRVADSSVSPVSGRRTRRSRPPRT